MPRSDSQSDRSRSKSKQRVNGKEPSPQQDNSCLYIGNIDKKITQEKLTSLFGDFGELQYCYIVYQPHTSSDRANRGEPKQSRGYGFAKYKNNDDALRAREKLQGYDLNGRRITVDVSKRSRPREPTPGRYLGKVRSSPVRRQYRDRRSYSRSSSRSRSNRHSSKRYHHEKHDKHRRHSRSRSDSHRRHRSSYSRSPRR